MFDPERLLVFLDVIECGSFTLAAAKRRTSKAAISKQISALESECGLQLITRSTRSLQLTETGELIFEHARQMKACVGEIQTILKGHKKTPQGRLKVFAALSFAKRYLIGGLKDWLKQYPRVTLELELGERIPNLEREGFDLVVGLSIEGPPTSIQKRIGSTRYVLCASPAYIKQHGQPRKVEELASHPYLAHTARKANYLIKIGQREIVLTPYLYVNDVHSLISLALNGVGFAWVHDYAVDTHLSAGTLVELFPSTQTKDIPLYAYYPATKFTPSKVRAFIQFVERLQT